MKTEFQYLLNFFRFVKDLGNDNNNKIISSEFIMFEEPKKGLMIEGESHGFMLNDKNIFSDKLRRFKKNLNPAIRYTKIQG